MAAKLRSATGSLDVKMGIRLEGAVAPVEVTVILTANGLALKKKRKQMVAFIPWDNILKHVRLEGNVMSKYMADPGLFFREE